MLLLLSVAANEFYYFFFIFSLLKAVITHNLLTFFHLFFCIFVHKVFNEPRQIYSTIIQPAAVNVDDVGTIVAYYNFFLFY